MGDGIVIVGGGFAGFWAAAAARRVAGGRAAVSLVSPDPALQMRPRLYEANPAELSVDLPPLLGRIEVGFVRDAACSIDLAARQLALASGARLGYERLVVATGSRMRRPPVRGVEACHSIDTQTEAIAFDRRLAEIAATGGAASIAVVGAGFTGIELALELRDRFAAHADDAAAERLRIVLVDRAETVGVELGPGPRPTIEGALADAGIEVLVGALVTGLGPDRVTLADGTTLEVDAVVLTTGLEAASFAGEVPGRRDELGRIVVDESLRAPDAPDVFVAGDAAAADTGDGHLALQSCQHALQLGRYAGENAARDLLGLATVPYRQLRYVTCLDLGRSGAVLTNGWDRTVQRTGADAKARKRLINTSVIYPPGDASADTLLRMSSTDPAEQGRP